MRGGYRGSWLIPVVVVGIGLLAMLPGPYKADPQVHVLAAQSSRSNTAVIDTATLAQVVNRAENPTISGTIIGLLGAFAGAFAGAFWGNAFAFKKAITESGSRRRTLLAQLARELDAARLPPSDDTSDLGYTRPLHLPSLTKLLDGTTLVASDHTPLINAFVALDRYKSAYNADVDALNQALLDPTKPEEAISILRTRLGTYLNDMRDAVNEAKSSITEYQANEDHGETLLNRLLGRS